MRYRKREVCCMATPERWIEVNAGVASNADTAMRNGTQLLAIGSKHGMP